MDFRSIRIERNYGYYFELSYYDGKYWIEVDRGDHICEHDYFDTEDEAYDSFASVYYEYTGEWLPD